MGKRKQEVVQELVQEDVVSKEGRTGIKLKDASYWKWRLTIEEWEHAKTKVNLASAQYKIDTLNGVVAQLSAQIAGNRVSDLKAKVEAAKKDYVYVKEQIEKEIGRSLTSCSIDEFTYEVVELPDNNPNKEK